MFIFVALLIVVLTTLYYIYSVWYEQRSQQEFAKRNVPYKHTNGFLWAWLRSERIEWSNDAIIRNEGLKNFGFNMLFKPTILVSDPEIIQLVLSKEFTHFVNRRVCFV